MIKISYLEKENDFDIKPKSLLSRFTLVRPSVLPFGRLNHLWAQRALLMQLKAAPVPRS